MADFIYRKGTFADCRQVFRLICEMEQRELPYDSFMKIFRKQLLSDSYACLVCSLDEKVIGVLNLRFEEQLHHSARIAEVMEFAILPDYRKKGVGKEMLTKACKLAKEFGCIQIEAACNQLRTDTHRFYAREGMHNFHFKFSKLLTGNDTAENEIGM